MALAAFEKAASSQAAKVQDTTSQPKKEQAFACQLCHKVGHTASECTEVPYCSKCLLNGHIAACCPHTNGECFGCGQMGHLLTHCPMRRGRGSAGIRGRGRGRGPPIASSGFQGACFNCGRVGHSARYCVSTPKPAGVKREPAAQTFSSDQLASIADSLSRAAVQRSVKTIVREAGGEAPPKSEK